MRVILGIGNPGAQYLLTRHNIGFMVVDLLAQRLLVDVTTPKYHSHTGLAVLGPGDGGHRLLLMKPQTYVNLSGQALQEAMAFHKLQPEECLVVTDDLNLPLGTLRLRASGSHGGHNGLRDIEGRIGRQYPRLRIGIGTTGGAWKSHVLGRFAEDEMDDVGKALNKACDQCQLWLRDDLDAAMRLNGPLHPPPPRPKPPKPEAPAPDADDSAPAADGDAAGSDAGREA